MANSIFYINRIADLVGLSPAVGDVAEQFPSSARFQWNGTVWVPVIYEPNGVPVTVGGGGGGTVTTTGSPASGNLTKFSGAASITNGDLTGDVTTSGTLAATLASTAVTPGTYGDATHVPQVTVDSKGRLTAAANVAITGSTITRPITFGWNNNGSPLPTGTSSYIDIYVPYAFTITAVTLLADQSGSVQLDIWEVPYASYPGTIANTIVASDPPLISAALKSQDATLTGWTKTFTAGATLRISITSVTAITRLAGALTVTS